MFPGYCQRMTDSKPQKPRPPFFLILLDSLGAICLGLALYIYFIPETELISSITGYNPSYQLLAGVGIILMAPYFIWMFNWIRQSRSQDRQKNNS